MTGGHRIMKVEVWPRLTYCVDLHPRCRISLHGRDICKRQSDMRHPTSVICHIAKLGKKKICFSPNRHTLQTKIFRPVFMVYLLKTQRLTTFFSGRTDIDRRFSL